MIDRPRHPPRSRVRPAGVWLGVLALVIQTLVPLGLAVPAFGSAAGEGAALVVCQAYGTKAVPADVADSTEEDASARCSVCLSYSLGRGAAMASPVVVTPPGARALRVGGPPARAHPGDLVPAAASARAPPVS